MYSIKQQFYYAQDAYDSRQIPNQADASRRSFLHKTIGCRLPWGNTQEVVPIRILEDPTPETMRFWKDHERKKNEKKANGTYVPRPLEHFDLHIKHDHEVIRHAQLPFRSQFWLFLRGGGKWLTIILIPILILTHFTVMSSSEETAWEFTSGLILSFYSWAIGVPLASWAIGHIVINNFPAFWFRPPAGPLWELNRRTGKLKIFNYKNFKTQGKIEEAEAPFYEFDAYIITSPDRQGTPMNGLSLAHRYRDIGINFNDLIAPDNTTQQPCALWDFLQNFMDISRPLPEIPAHEPYRHLDPVTASHDLKNGRNARYWIDMENDTFNIKVKQMRTRIDTIDTFNRPNLMAMHVKYPD